MASFYIQTQNGLLPITGELTAENISRALGYVPSSFSGNFNDINDNPINDNADSEFIIVDESGNIICKIDSTGLVTTSVTTTDVILDGKSLLTRLQELQGSIGAPGTGNTTTDLSEYVKKTELEASVTKIVEDNIPEIDAKSISVDTSKKWLRVSEEMADGTTKSYFLQLTELVKPNSPTISTVTYNVVTGSVTVAISAVSGTTTEYKVGDAAWATGTSISIASNYSNSAVNSTKTVAVKVRAALNGEYSDERSYTITIKPKVAAGTISVTRTPNNNNWATKAVVALSPSATTGAKSEYSKDSGSSWTEFTSKVEFTETTTQSANKYQIRATKADYVNSDVSKNSAITLNALKAYYGASSKTTLTEADIIALTATGGSSEATKLAVGNYTIKPTSASYVWICTTNTMPYSTIVNNKGDIIPFGFEAAVKVGGWNCYRSSNTINSDTNIYIPS